MPTKSTGGAQHTKGPLNMCGCSAVIIKGEAFYQHCQLHAVAPDLLAVCDSIANELQAWASTDDPRPASWTVSRIKRLRAAIAKATK